MYVPTARFRELQLSGDMPPHTRSMSGDPVRERAILVRDILSSFKEDCLPSEYMPDVFQGILSKTSIEDEPRKHVKQGDLQLTLFHLGAYYEEALPCIRMMQSDETLSRIYCETLLKRFDALFTDYDQLEPTSTDPDPQGEVTKMIVKLRDYYKDAVQDRRERRRRESVSDTALTLNIDRRFASMLITQLRALCERSGLRHGLNEDEPAPKKPKMSSSRVGQTSPRTTPTTKSYLFEQILGNVSAQTGFFALDVLERCSAESLEGFQPDQDRKPGLRGLQVLLESKGASQAYQARFANLVTQEDEEQ